MTPEQQTVPAKVLQARATQAYADQSRAAAEEQWILKYLPLVRHVVQKVADNVPRGADFDDLISAGTLGLVKAARSFDPTRETSFKTYAYIRIRGAVLDELRSRTFVPSNVITQVRAIEAAHQRLAGKLGHAPSDEELADEVGISIEQLYRTLQEARRRHFLSIHGLTEEDPALAPLLPADQGDGPDAEAEKRDLCRRLAEAITELPERDRTLILLYYERDLTMKEAAEVLGVTESRISQLHAAALFKLSMRLKRPA